MSISVIGKHKIVVDTTTVANGDSLAAYLADAAGNLINSQSINASRWIQATLSTEYAEDSAHASGDRGQFALGVRDDGVQASATVGPNVFTAVNFGVSGNSIALIFDGIDDVSTVVAAWNAANPANQVSFTGSGATVPAAQTVTLANGFDNKVQTSADGDYSPLAVDKYGRLKVQADLDVDFDYVYAEDSAHTSGDLGGFSLAVRRDSRSSGTSANGDYGSFNVNAVGELWVKDADALVELVAANASLDAIEASVASIDTSTNNIEADIDEMNTSLNNIEADADEMNTSINNIELYALNQQHAEDAAHVSGDIGTFALAVRNDANAVLTSADGDYSPFAVDSAGRMKLDPTTLGLYAEDSVAGSGDMGSLALVQRQDDDVSSVSATGDYSAAHVDALGRMKTISRANVSNLQQMQTVTTTAAALPASPLANRQNLLIQNTGSGSIFIGSATVTASGATKGVEIPKGGSLMVDAGPSNIIYALTAVGTADVVLWELS